MTESSNTNPPSSMSNEGLFAVAEVPAFLLKPTSEAAPIQAQTHSASPGADLFSFSVDTSFSYPQPVAARFPTVSADLVSVPSARPALRLDGDDPDVQAQFRLRRLQAFNWGTFQGVADFPIATEGYLFVGNSGSGKSTMLDGLAALTTPDRWRAFNAAAREADRGRSDRNLVTYVRGAWARQSNDEREAVQQFLRKGTTWSVLAATYCNMLGATVSIVMLMWIRGKARVHATYGTSI